MISDPQVLNIERTALTVSESVPYLWHEYASANYRKHRVKTRAAAAVSCEVP
jgi:hypothetical protein